MTVEELIQAIKDYIAAVGANEGVYFIDDIQNPVSRDIVQHIYEEMRTKGKDD